MPTEFDPEWEYYVPDPEIAEVTEAKSVSRDGMNYSRDIHDPRVSQNYSVIKLLRLGPCPMCGKEIVTPATRPNRKVCSRTCAGDYVDKKGKKYRRKCKQCGKRFETRFVQKFRCSYRCNERNRQCLRSGNMVVYI